MRFFLRDMCLQTFHRLNDPVGGTLPSLQIATPNAFPTSQPSHPNLWRCMPGLVSALCVPTPTYTRPWPSGWIHVFTACKILFFRTLRLVLGLQSLTFVNVNPCVLWILPPWLRSHILYWKLANMMFSTHHTPNKYSNKSTSSSGWPRYPQHDTSFSSLYLFYTSLTTASFAWEAVIILFARPILFWVTAPSNPTELSPSTCRLLTIYSVRLLCLYRKIPLQKARNQHGEKGQLFFLRSFKQVWANFSF